MSHLSSAGRKASPDGSSAVGTSEIWEERANTLSDRARQLVGDGARMAFLRLPALSRAAALPRATASRMFDRLERLTGFPVELRRAAAQLGYWPDIRTPRTFNEKVLWRKIFDRNPLIPATLDKVGVRDYVRERLGPERAAQALLPLLDVQTRPTSLAFDQFPFPYVLKTNNGWGTNIFVWDAATLDRPRAIRRLQRWMYRPNGQFRHEWGYSAIRPLVFAEPLMLDDRGEVPSDYKFHVFHGRCRLIQFDEGRFAEPRRSLYTRDWTYVDGRRKKAQAPPTQAPERLDQMLELAEHLAAPFDYVRVDLYDWQDRVVIGELTHYPGKGYAAFEPMELELEMGSYWRLPVNGSGPRK
jgi:hypothetical protein